MENNTLFHHGIKGMKWGIRRTPAQLGHKIKQKVQKRTADTDGSQKTTSAKKTVKKSVKEMSNEELRDRINRLQLERTALDLERSVSSLSPKEISAGKKIIDSLAKDVISPAAKNVGKQYLEKTLSNKLGINTKDPLEKLGKEAKSWKYKQNISEAKKKIAENDDWFSSRAGESGRQESKQSGEKQNRQSNSDEGADRDSGRTTIVDVDYRDVSTKDLVTINQIKNGRKYVSGLLEDRRKK